MAARGRAAIAIAITIAIAIAMASLGRLLCVLGLLLCGFASPGLSRPYKRGTKRPIIGKEAWDRC